MSIQDLGAIGEFVGSMLILVTLIYIAIQTNHARKSQLSVEQQAVHSGHREFFLTVMNSPELPGIMTRATAGEALTDEERTRLGIMCQARLNLILMQFQLRKVGIGEEIDLEEEAQELRDLFRNYGGFLEDHWPTIKHAYARDFVAYIDRTVQPTG
ncbi:MAG TPA: hypothetical protein VLA36_09595 [Longimicrobiales bacterium]|nr:hypothetical protein [Longimicrobiales bacterium]